MATRQIVLDTETTGLEPSQGHRIIEIGCVELVNRRLTGNHYHQYIQPEREIDQGALEVHGISNEFLSDKPVFAHVLDEFLAFIDGAELIIHNAPFDIGFIDHELKLAGSKIKKTSSICGVIDSLVLARKKHPGQKNNLDALCKRYAVDNAKRELHGALLDAEILADVYLMMTGGQTSLYLGGEVDAGSQGEQAQVGVTRLDSGRQKLPVIAANAEELAAHDALLATIDKKSDGQCLWLKAPEA
ncbi:MAG: DNA polymerase III subunit epsilon [Pseudomonadales bacterium]|jgi:DNA polymerase-3 subunit epsilon|nr:DNA polymerase III subunit epsilon [Pseudomonadales bacterium]